MRNSDTSLSSRIWFKMICYNNYHGAFIALNALGAVSHCGYSAAVLATYASVWIAKRLTAATNQPMTSIRT